METRHRKVGLRTQLVLSFLLVIVLTVTGVGLLASRFTERQFNIYVSGTGRVQAGWLTPLFAEYYERHGSWGDIGMYITDLNRPPWEALLPAVETGDFFREEMNEQDWLHWERDQLSEFVWQQALWAMINLVGDGQILLADSQGVVVADSGGDAVGVRLSPSNLEKGAPVLVDGQTVGTVVVAAGLGVSNPQESAFLRHVNRGLLAIGLTAAVFALAAVAMSYVVPSVEIAWSPPFCY